MGPSPILFILGAGSNVGASVARAFAAKGYRVALASRKTPDTEIVEGQFHVVSDLSDPSNVADTFAKVRKALGTPNVVVYNGQRAPHNNNSMY